MEKGNYDTYCGLYCGACDILRSYERGHESKFAHLWTKPALKAFLNVHGTVYKDNDLELKCKGCKSDDIFIVCRICNIRKCAIDKNVEHCTDCEDYPCEIYSEWKKAQRVLPHIESTQGNLDAIDKFGTDKWLLDQEEQWKCSKCGTSFSWYSTTCDSCGTDLKEHSFKFSKFKVLIMRTMVRLSSLRQNKQ